MKTLCKLRAKRWPLRNKYEFFCQIQGFPLLYNSLGVVFACRLSIIKSSLRWKAKRVAILQIFFLDVLPYPPVDRIPPYLKNKEENKNGLKKIISRCFVVKRKYCLSVICFSGMIIKVEMAIFWRYYSDFWAQCCLLDLRGCCCNEKNIFLECVGLFGEN